MLSRGFRYAPRMEQRRRGRMRRRSRKASRSHAFDSPWEDERRSPNGPTRRQIATFLVMACSGSTHGGLWIERHSCQFCSYEFEGSEPETDSCCDHGVFGRLWRRRPRCKGKLTCENY